MLINLWEIPIFIGNIDSKKIELKCKNFESTWISDTNSTHEFSRLNKVEDQIEKKSAIYLLNVIAKILEEKFNFLFKLNLLNIWENNYNDNDYQEPHIHTSSDFSFIIYKEGEEGKTVFFNPSRNFILPYTNISHLFKNMFVPSCKMNQIIIFPSFVEHMVLKCSNVKTISGNLNFIKDEIK